MKQHLVQSPRWRMAILTLPLVLAGVIAIPVAHGLQGPPGLWALGVAWGTCCLSGLLAWWLVQRFQGPNQALQQLLMGTMVRMGPPLALVLVTQTRGGVLADAGLVYYILTFYLITLVVETAVLTSTLSQSPAESQTS